MATTQRTAGIPIDERVTVASGVRLHVRRWNPGGPAGGRTGRQFLLVHGLASNARVWDGVADRLSADGYPTLAVDLRGHGESDRPDGGYDMARVSADLAELCGRLGLTAPVVAGQSWGGNVVLEFAARHPDLPHALALLDGGWIHLSDTFPGWERCWAALAPPGRFDLTLDGMRATIRAAHPDWPDTGVEGTLANLETGPGGVVRARLALDRHRAVLRSLWEHRPREVYPRVGVPVLLMPAERPGAGSGRAARSPALVTEALGALPHARVSRYVGADHDLHAQHPDRVAIDLETLA